VLAIGNELRGDDGLGPLFAKKLSQIINDSSNVVVIDGGTVPENFTGSLRNEKPTHVILIDAVEMNGNPGDIEFIEKERISQFNVSTHAMPISFLIKYLETTSSFKIILIGIQPKKMVLGEEVTLEVENSINDLVNIFKKSFKDYDLI
jgi:hydrogenase 3 maturation protease